MIKDVTLGQYFPGSSVIHRADPRMKLIGAVLYITAVFLAKSVAAFALIIAATAVIILLSGLRFSMILRGMKPLLYILIFTAIINVFWVTGEKVLFSFWIIHIYLEGIIYALLMMVRITCLLTGTSVLISYTTSPIQLTDGLEQLISPLKKLHLPVHEFSMMMTIALRFIPTLVEETDRIMSAQKARGSDFSSGNVFQRAKALIPVLIPLFVSAFRRADDLATAMECRCYHGGEGRTRMKTLKMQKSDLIFLAAFLLLCASAVLINIYIPIYSI